MKNTLQVIFLTLVASTYWLSTCFSQTFGPIDIPIYKNGVLLSDTRIGGLQSPHFSNIDINGDGIKDLFVFDRVGNQVLPFIKIGPVGSIEYRFAPEYIDMFPPLVNWVLLRDYNGDGIEDIFTSCSDPTSFSFGFNIEVWEGERLPNGRLNFKKILFDYGNNRNILQIKTRDLYNGLYTSNIDVPAIVDIDNDGDLDVFTFDPSSVSVIFNKNLSVEMGRPLHEFHLERSNICWGNFVEGQNDENITLSNNPNQCARSNLNDDNSTGLRHDGSTLNILDLNGDDLPDLLIGDIGFSNIQALINGGTTSRAHMVSVERTFPLYDVPIDLRDFVATFSVDVDGDGIRDLIAITLSQSGQNTDHIWYYKNDGADNKPIYRLVTKNFLMDKTPNLFSYSHPTFVDVNQDGLMDILIGTGGINITDIQRENRMVLMINKGTIANPVYEITDEDYLSLSKDITIIGRLAPTFGDMDGDGDLDLILGDAIGNLSYFENTAGPERTFEFSSAPIYYYPNEDFTVFQNAKPFIYDVNQDGLSDLVIGKRNTQLHVLINQGTKENPTFTTNPSVAPNIFNLGEFLPFTASRLRNGAPAFITSGEKTLLVFGTENAGILTYDTHVGTNTNIFTQMTSTTENLLKDMSLVPTLYDINNNGYYEMAVGNARGGIQFFSTGFKVGTSSTEAQIPASQVKVYPNPSLGWIGISTSLEDFSLQLMDINGKLIKEMPKTNIYDISDLNSGTYLIRLTNHLESVTQKFILLK